MDLPDRSLQVKQFRFGMIKVDADQVFLDTNKEVIVEFGWN